MASSPRSAATEKRPFLLTAAQLEARDASVLAWRRIANEPRRIDHRRAEAAVSELYRALGELPPSFVWFDSPLAAANALGGPMREDVPPCIDTGGVPRSWSAGGGARLADNVTAILKEGLARALSRSLEGPTLRELGVLGALGSLRPSAQPLAHLESEMAAYGELDLSVDELGIYRGSAEFRCGFLGGELGALCTHELCRDCLGVEYEPHVASILAAAIGAAKECAEYWPYRGLCVLSERPIELHLDEHQRLHHASLPALRYGGGERYYAWHGTIVPPELLEAPERFDVGFAFRWSNLEVRRAVLEILDADVVLSRLGATLVDRDPDSSIGELFASTLSNAHEAPRLLRVKCATGRKFLLCVPPTVRTAREANAWTYGLDSDTCRLEVRT